MSLTGNLAFDGTILILSILAALYLYMKHKFTYWQRRGVPIPFEPAIPLGHFNGVQVKKNLGLMIADVYKLAKKEKFVGVHFLGEPLLMVNDLELAKTLLIKDFSLFQDRGIDVDLKKEPLSAHLFFLNGQEWRNLRIKLTPTFTTGKMKIMFSTLIDVGKHLVEVLENESIDEEVDVKDVLARYTSDVIASCAFGLEINSLKNPNNDFRKYGEEITRPKLLTRLSTMFIFMAPRIAKYLPVKFTPSHISNFFYGVVKDTMNYREENKIRRNDFLQLLIELKTQGYVKDSDKNSSEQVSEQKFTIDQAAAQVFLFFIAGFETSSSTMEFALYELALNPEMQLKVQSEVDRVIEKHDGQITYDALHEMEYLDRIVQETLRKYVVTILLIRKCSTDYKIPGTNVTIEKDTKIWFPIYGYHHDPQYYPDPEKFDPDRFLPEVKEKRPHFAFMPFGEGPRNCIGSRFAIMQVKTGLSILLSNFSDSPSSKTPIPMVFDPKADMLSSKGKMFLNLTKRSSS